MLDIIYYFINSYQLWVLCISCSCLIGLTGILPMIVFKFNDSYFKNEDLSLLLSFSVGSLLGDVFLHLLPEVVKISLKESKYPFNAYNTIGIWIIIGIFTFVLIDIVFKHFNSNDKSLNTNIIQKNNHKNNNHKKKYKDKRNLKTKTIESIGYLNLLANAIDNFNHGLAVSTSFMSGVKMGLLTTFTIIIHEIPHELGDFAILLDSGFSKWQAIRGQLLTASVGICGAIFALIFNYINRSYIDIRILSFTCGAFLNISLINLLPKLLNETDIWQSIKQMLFIGLGVAVMGVVNYFD